MLKNSKKSQFGMKQKKYKESIIRYGPRSIGEGEESDHSIIGHNEVTDHGDGLDFVMEDY